MKFRSTFFKQQFKVIIWFRSALREVPKESFFFQAVIFLIDMDPKRPNIIFMRQTSIRHLISVNVFPYAPLAWWDGGKRRNGGKACVCVSQARPASSLSNLTQEHT